MNLYRIRLRPASPWRTPWQADTLLGALCSVAARVHGADFLRRQLIDPMLAGMPPFVISDAFPGRLLPVPAAVRLAQPPPEADRKAVKRGRWLSREDFLALRATAGEGNVPWARLLANSEVFCDEPTRHNTLARDSDASLEDGGLFTRRDTLLRTHVHNVAEVTSRTPRDAGLQSNSALENAHYLSLYFRARDEAAGDLLVDLLHELALIGFGADVGTGRGQFEIAADPEPAAELDEEPPGANGIICLSTFQPAAGNPTDGLWEAFPKFGKLGPDLGLADVRVRKHTLVMFRPGACFWAEPAPPYLGRALPMDEVLPAIAAAELESRGIRIIHPAFGLAIPAGFKPFKEVMS